MEILNKTMVNEVISRGNKLPNIDGLFVKYRIPLDDLILNPYNDRLAVEILDYQKEGGELTSESGSQEKLGEMIWKSNETRNTTTLKDILKNGLLQNIVVDNQGIILDGNRRVTILKRILKGREKYNLSQIQIDNFSRPEVILVPKKLTKEEIHKYETKLQISEDAKLEYEPINMYLKIYRLFKESKREDPDKKCSEIADLMGAGWKKTDVKKCLETFNVMRKYLIYMDQKDKFILLRKREDHFKQISLFEKYFNSGSVKLKDIKLTTENKNRIEKVLFTMTSGLYEGKAFRDIIPGNKTIDKTPISSDAGLKVIEDFFEREKMHEFAKKEPSQKFGDGKLASIKGIIKTASRAVKKDDPSRSILDSVKKMNDCAEKIMKWSKGLKENEEVPDEILREIKDISKKLYSVTKEFHED